MGRELPPKPPRALPVKNWVMLEELAKGEECEFFLAFLDHWKPAEKVIIKTGANPKKKDYYADLGTSGMAQIHSHKSVCYRTKKNERNAR